MKDFAHKSNKPKKLKTWHDKAREITENIIILWAIVFSSIIIISALI